MAYYTQEQLDKMRASLKRAKETPTDPKSQEIFKRINEGKMNFELKALGIEPVKVERPKIDLQAAMKDVQMEKNVQTMAPDKNKSFMSDIGQDIKEGVQGLQQIGPERGQKAAERLQMMGGAQTFGQGGFGAVAQGVGALIDTAEVFAKTIAKATMSPEKEDNLKRNLAETAAKIPGLQSGMELLNASMEKIKQSDPDLARSLEDAGILSEAFVGTSKPVRQGVELGIDAASQTAEQTGRAARAGGEMLQEGVEGAARATGEALDTATAGRRSAELTEQQARVDTATKNILRSGADDRAMEAGKRVFSQIDRTNLDTYDSIDNALSTNLKALAEQQDELLGGFSNKFTSEDLTRTTQVGDQAVSQNPVTEALDQLINNYTATADPTKAAKYSQLKQRLEGGEPVIDADTGEMRPQGLTIQELNEIARVHGNELSGFNASGELASGLNKQAYENTRKGIKETLRGKVAEITDDATRQASEALDSAMSDIYTVRPFIEKLEERAAQLEQRTYNPTVMESLKEKGLTALDIASLGSVARMFPRALPGQRINNSMSYKETEEMLKRNLEEFDKLEQIKDSKTYADRLAEYLKQPPIGMSIRDISRTADIEDDLVLDNLMRLDVTDVKKKEDMNKLLDLQRAAGNGPLDEDQLLDAQRIVEDSQGRLPEPDTTDLPGVFSNKQTMAEYNKIPDGTSFNRGGVTITKKGNDLIASGQNAKETLQKSGIDVDENGVIKQKDFGYNVGYFIDDVKKQNQSFKTGETPQTTLLEPGSQEISINDLRVNTENISKQSRENIDKIKNGILTKGQEYPIAITPEGSLVDGYHRYVAMKELGVEKIPVYVGKQDGSSGRLEGGMQSLKVPIKLPKTSTLLEEAKKYESADDFVKALPTGDELDVNIIGTKTGEPVRLRSYHGTKEDFDRFSFDEAGDRIGKGGSYSGRGFYFTPSEGGASSFGKAKEVVLDLKNPYVTYLPESNIDKDLSAVAEFAQRKGHDSMIVRSRDTDSDQWIKNDLGEVTDWGEIYGDTINEIVVFDEKGIVTKEQLD